jgi:hypothetical protein
LGLDAPAIDAGRVARALPARRDDCNARDHAAILLEATARGVGLAAGVLGVELDSTPDDWPLGARAVRRGIALAGGVLAFVVALHDGGQGVQARAVVPSVFASKSPGVRYGLARSELPAHRAQRRSAVDDDVQLTHQCFQPVDGLHAQTER